MFALHTPQTPTWRTGLLQGEHPEIFARMEWVRKKWFLAYKSSNMIISLKRGKIGPRLLLRSNRKSYALSIGAKINDLGWPWRVFMHSVSKHVRLSELTVKIRMKVHLYCQRRRCSPMTVVSGNIRFVPIFEGVHWREGIKRQCGSRKHGFSRLSKLRLQHVKKWGQRYYILLFNPFSPFHWPRNILQWLSGLNGHYTL